MPYIPPPELRSLSLSDIAQLSQDRKLPPVDQWNPKHSSDSKMQIIADGRWFHEGDEIKREAMVRAFSSLLRKDDNGYWLVTPYEKQSIIVDDAPFIAVEMNSQSSGKDRQISIRLNNDEIIAINADHAVLMQTSDGHSIPYIHVRGGMMAKCSRAVAYELFETAIEDNQNMLVDNIVDNIQIWSDGACFDLGSIT